jgi:penicillin-binding protein 2
LILIEGADELRGFGVQNNPIRDYKDAEAFAHLVGYTGKITAEELASHEDADYILNDYIGKGGVEYQYENLLRGVLGKRQSEIDAVGNFKKTLAEIPPQPGNNLRLNIDYELQKQIYDSLMTVMGRIGAKKAAAVATNPQTGEVLALLSLPSFDNNMFARGIRTDEYSVLINDENTPLLNRVLSGTYPPGSTIKPMMAVAALTEGVVTPETKILDNGVIRVGAYSFYGYERSGLGNMDIYSAIARSSDIYFYSVGGGNPASVVKDGLGPDRIATYLRKFNLGTPLGIDLPSEKAGLVPDPAWKEQTKNEQWFLGNTYHYSIGQGDLLTTPLQVNSWTATIGNGGRVMQPYVLHSVTDRTDKVITEGTSKILAENIFDPNYIKVAQDGMRQTVTEGSARSLATLPIPISGKTGTAQFDARNLSRTHAWFTSYAPSDNPQIALTILVEAGGEGSSVAVPVSKEVYNWWIANRYNRW